MVKFVSCVVSRPVDASSLPSLLSNVTWVAILFINDLGAFICDYTFCASFLFCILTWVYDIEWLILYNADTTSLFPVSWWATIPKLKKKKQEKWKWLKEKQLDLWEIQMKITTCQNLFACLLFCYEILPIWRDWPYYCCTLVWRCYSISSTMNFKGWVNCCVNGVVKFR